MATTSSIWARRLDELKQDARFAVRGLSRSPAFTAVAILTLAVGIGANSAVFTVVNGVLLKPLPFPHPEQLLAAWQNNTTSTSSEPGPVSPVNFEDWRARRKVIADMGGYWYGDGATGRDMTGIGEPQRLGVAFITPGFWGTFHVPAAVGRLPRDDEMVRGANDRLVVLSHAFWKRQFGAATTVIGKHVTLNGDSYEIVGVLPESFHFPSPRADAYIPYSTIPEQDIPFKRSVAVLEVVARIKPGVNLRQANAELMGIARELAEQYPENRRIAAASAAPLGEAIFGQVRTTLFVLQGAVVFVLLIGAINLASLFLARSMARERELAVRGALGATRTRLIQQLLTEVLLLLGAGAIVGVFIANVGGSLLLRLARGQLPRADDVAVDSSVVLFALLVSIATGLIVGLLPAIRATSPQLQHALRDRSRAGPIGVRGLRATLVVTEVALAMILVTGSGLAARSFINLLRRDFGFSTEQRVAINFTLSSARHPGAEEIRAIYRQMLDKVRSAPEVIAAGTTWDLPFSGTGAPIRFLPQGTPPGPNGERPTATLMFVSDGFFDAIGIPVRAGRDLSPDDRYGAPGASVINQALAKKYFRDRNPIGQTLLLGDTTHSTIVGVVGDVRPATFDDAPTPRVYASVLQLFKVRVNLVVRTRDDPSLAIKRIEDAIRTVDPQQTVTAAFSLDDALSESLGRPRLLTAVLALFGGMALLLGALGIYGVLAYLVTQRTREIGVRIALGAQRRDVLQMVINNGLALSTVGIAIGLIGALALTRLMQGVLYRVAPHDPLTFSIMTLALLCTGIAASWFPALRATRVDPLEALRAE